MRHLSRNENILNEKDPINSELVALDIRQRLSSSRSQEKDYAL